MAEVYLGEIVGPGGFRKPVAIKRLLEHYAEDQRFVEMLHDEARIVAAINHRHITKVFDLGAIDGLHYIAMEFVDGVDLAAVMRSLRVRDVTMPVEAAVYVARCVAEGLHGAHMLTDTEGRSLGVIHRDVSPHNILLSYDGDVKLTDFGVAKARSNLTQTRSGVIKGKILYMSPEQAQAKPLDAGADIFSLGLTLYKMLTGRSPFTGDNEFQVYEQLLHTRPVSPRLLVPHIPAKVDAIVMRALRKPRKRRFDTAQDMAGVLGQALDEINPWYSAQDLGQFMQRETPRGNLVARSDDDDAQPADGGADIVSIDIDEEEANIDRLTRLDGVYASADESGDLPEPPDTDVHQLPSEPIEARFPASELGPPGGEASDLERAQGSLFAPSRRRDSVDSLVPIDSVGSTDSDIQMVIEAGVNAVITAGHEQPSGIADAARPHPVRPADVNPAPVAIPVGGRATVDGISEDTSQIRDAGQRPTTPEPPDLRVTSSPSVHTSDLKWLPRRRLPYVLAAFLAAAVATAVVLAVDRQEDRPAPKLTPAKSPGLERLMRNALSDDRPTTIDGLDPSDVPVVARVPSRPHSGVDDPLELESDERPTPVPPSTSKTAPAKRPSRRGRAGGKPTRKRPPKPSPAREKSGYVKISSLPWAWVEIDGVPIERHTPLLRHELPPGRHTVSLRTEDGRTHRTSVLIAPGKTVSLKHAFD